VAWEEASGEDHLKTTIMIIQDSKEVISPAREKRRLMMVQKEEVETSVEIDSVVEIDPSVVQIDPVALQIILDLDSETQMQRVELEPENDERLG